MNESAREIQSDPKTAVAAYIQELEDSYYPWYDKATNRDYYSWFVAQAVSLLAGFGTAITAALLNERQFAWIGGRITLIVLPLVGSLASTFLVQSRIADLETLRERGRETLQHLSSEARAKFASIGNAEGYTQLHLDLIECVSKLEEEQARAFRTIIPEQLTFSQRRTRRANARQR